MLQNSLTLKNLTKSVRTVRDHSGLTGPRLAGKMAEFPDFVCCEAWRGGHDFPALPFAECVSQAVFAVF